jgi:hypothetical protein
LANWIKKEDPIILQEIILLTEINWLRVKSGRTFTKPMALKTGKNSNSYLR